MSANAAGGLPDCTHRPPCPGCPRYGEPGIGEAAALALRRLADVSDAALLPPREASAAGYRHRARLMVRGRASAPKVGLFQTGSHRIVDIPRCHVHHPVINAVAAALKQAMRRVGASPYADAPHRGLVRALQVVIERASRRAQVVVVANASEPAGAEPLLAALQGALGDVLHSLWWNGNPERSNTILGPAWGRIAGPESVRETIGGAEVHFPPGAFGQSHLHLADALVAEVHGAVPAGARVAECYAGSGAIGLGLLARGHEVAFNEASEHGLHGLALGLAALPAAARSRAVRLPGTAGSHAAALVARDVLIADPPRKGLDAALRDALRETPPARLLYVSCDVASLADDAAALLAGGNLRLARLEPFALFPFTEHVETLARFERT